jgi:phage gp36-like protein
VSSYATLADLNAYGLPASALGDVTLLDQQAQLDAASTLADGFLRNRFTLPIVAPFSADLVMAVAQIAAWNLLRRRGFNPEDPGGEAVRLGYTDAMAWLKRVADGTTTPMLTDSSGQPAGGSTGGPFVVQPQSTGTTDAAGYPGLTTGTPRSRGWVR